MKRNLIPALALAVFVAAGPAWAAGITSAAGFDARVQTQVLLLNNEAAAVGDATMAQRLSTAFQVPTDVLLQERAASGLSWSDVFLAHTIASNTRVGITADQVLQMRASGMTWNAISQSVRIPRARLMNAAAIAARVVSRNSLNGQGIEARFQRQTAFVNSAAMSGGDQAVAQSLSTQFGVSANTLLSERTTFQADWSDIFIAHTIQANSRLAVSTAQLLQMRASGMTWSQIGNAVQMSKTRLANALKIETRQQAGIQAAAGLGTPNQSFLSQATQMSDQATAQELSARLGISTSTLLQEKTQFGVSWNDILLAHTLAQSSRTSVTADQLLQMRATGMSWQQVSANAGVTLNRQTLSAIRNGNTETFVTTSLTGSTQNQIQGTSTQGGTIGGGGSINTGATTNSGATTSLQSGTTSGSCGTTGTTVSTGGSTNIGATVKTTRAFRVHGGMNATARLQARMNNAARLQARMNSTASIRATQCMQLMKAASATRVHGHSK